MGPLPCGSLPRNVKPRLASNINVLASAVTGLRGRSPSNSIVNPQDANKETPRAVVQGFRTFYTNIKVQRGEEALRQWLAVGRKLSQSIPDPLERGFSQSLIAEMEVELLGNVSDKR